MMGSVPLQAIPKVWDITRLSVMGAKTLITRLKISLTVAQIMAFFLACAIILRWAVFFDNAVDFLINL